MTQTEHQHGDRGVASNPYLVREAAAAEALALGHPEVDVEHLLLALLVVGGPSARALTGAGVDLPALRRAQAEVQQLDLGVLGISAPTRREVLRTGDRGAAPAVPVGGRARDLLDAAPVRGDDRGLLRALLDDGGRRAARLLEHLGVDVGALCESLGRDEARAPAAEGPSEPDGRAFAALRGPAPAGASWIEASWCQDLPVPLERVWALVSDPARRSEWDPSTTPQRVVQLEPGRAVAWRRRGTGTAEDPADAAEQVLQLVLQPAGAGTRVHLRHSAPGRGRGVRLSRPLLARMLRARLRVTAQAIAQAA